VELDREERIKSVEKNGRAEMEERWAWSKAVGEVLLTAGVDGKWSSFGGWRWWAAAKIPRLGRSSAAANRYHLMLPSANRMHLLSTFTW
jgi:hypothetical protein